MSRNTTVAIAGGASVVVLLGGWLALPALQSARRSVDSEAGVALERARRFLFRYDPGFDFQMALMRQLTADTSEVNPEGLDEDAIDEYQRVHSMLWQAYQPRDIQGLVARPIQANYGNVAGQIREGVRSQEDAARENEELLDHALTAVREALSFTVGSESSASYAEAHRLKGMILFYQGLSKSAVAEILRRKADPYRSALSSLALRAASLKPETQLVADARVNEQIDELRRAAREIEQSLLSDRAELDELHESIRVMESRLAEAETRRDRAKAALDRIRSKGMDLSDPSGAERFRDAFREQNRVYREAAREADALRFGTLPNATLDRGGDYLTGRYVEGGGSGEPTLEYGLRHYSDANTIVAERLAGREQALSQLQDDIARLEQLRDSLAASQTEAHEELTQAAADARDRYDELNRLDSEAYRIEEDALSLLDQSAEASKQAGRLVEQWIARARDRTQNLSPEARQRSGLAQRLQARWMGGFIAAQEADARIAQAWILNMRFQAYDRTAKILAGADTLLQLREVDASAEFEKAEEARRAGIETVTAAMGVLESAYGKADRHWTLTAQAAGATYLLTLFGRPEYLTDAMEAYRNAVKGREDQPAAAEFVARLHRLESRQP